MKLVLLSDDTPLAEPPLALVSHIDFEDLISSHRRAALLGDIIDAIRVAAAKEAKQ